MIWLRKVIIKWGRSKGRIPINLSDSLCIFGRDCWKAHPTAPLPPRSLTRVDLSLSASRLLLSFRAAPFFDDSIWFWFAPIRQSSDDSPKAPFGSSWSLPPTPSREITALPARAWATSFAILAFCLPQLYCQLLRRCSPSASPSFALPTSPPLLLTAAPSTPPTLPAASSLLTGWGRGETQICLRSFCARAAIRIHSYRWSFLFLPRGRGPAAPIASLSNGSEDCPDPQGSCSRCIRNSCDNISIINAAL